MNNTFDLYAEPAILTNILTLLSFVCISLVVYAQLLSIRTVLLYRNSFWMPTSIACFISALVASLTYLIPSLFNLVVQFVIVAITVWQGVKYIDKPSIKWTTLPLIMFIYFTAMFYAIFNGLVSEITNTFFVYHDIIGVVFSWNDFFSIQTSANVHNVKFDFMDGEVNISGGHEYIRNYLFYYFMLSLAMTFWIWTYLQVMKKHNFEVLKKQILEGKR